MVNEQRKKKRKKKRKVIKWIGENQRLNGWKERKKEKNVKEKMYNKD